MKWVNTNDKSDVHAKGQGQRSKVKVTEVRTQLSRFRTITPVCIHIWWWNDTKSLMLLRRDALLIFKVIRQISRSHRSKIIDLTQIGRFRTVTPVWTHWWLWNYAQSLKQHRRCALFFFFFLDCLSNFKVPRDKKWPISTRIGRFRTVTQVWIDQWLWNDEQSLK